MQTSPPSLLITGVSSGVGLATAQAFLRRGYRVFGSVRTEADASRLSAELGPAFVPLLFDVTDAAAVAQAVAEVERQLAGEPLRGLLNNAGIAVGGPLQQQPIAVVRQHFEVNVIGLVQVTQAFLPLLGARSGFRGRPGRVLHIGSVSGRVATPFVGAYVGTKHALEGISASWRRELQLFGIPMVLIGLGMTKTPIWEKGMNLEAYRDTPYFAPAERFARIINRTRAHGLTPEYVAERLVRIFETSRPKVRYTIVPDHVRNLLTLLLPAWVLDKVVGRGLGLRPPQQ